MITGRKKGKIFLLSVIPLKDDKKENVHKFKNKSKLYQ